MRCSPIYVFSYNNVFICKGTIGEAGYLSSIASRSHFSSYSLHRFMVGASPSALYDVDVLVVLGV